MIDFRAWEPHFADHLAPIWHALTPDERGAFVTDNTPRMRHHLTRLGIPPSRYDQHTPGATIIVASYGDLKRARTHGPVIYAEHGAGQTYTNPKTGQPLSGSYVGHGDRDGVILTLLPGPHAERTHLAAGGGPHATVGCPKLDAWLDRPAGDAVGITWHWDCRVCPETGSALLEFRSAIRDLHRRGVPIVGHAHPRSDWRMRRLCAELDIPYAEHLDDLVTTCSVLVADNTSAIYEWAAALDRPVVIVNSKRYRRDVHHGLRFWSHLPGETVDRPDRLHRAVNRALDDDPYANERHRVTADVYANLGTATAAAVQAIREVTA